MSSEGTTRQQTIKERAAKLQQEAAALQAQIIQHLEQSHGQPFGAAFGTLDDEPSA